MELTEEQLEMVVGGSDVYRKHLTAWKKYLLESGYGTFSMPAGIPSNPCPQGAQQVGFLGEPDGEGNPVPRCVRDGATINAQPTPMEEDVQEEAKERTFQAKLKPRLLKQMKRLLTHGGNQDSGPFKEKAPIDYRGSAPPGAPGG
tara:strand:+ start:141 stop:575 length:435 start_codon:yes stop_codon:yes gene_type:complete